MKRNLTYCLLTLLALPVLARAQGIYVPPQNITRGTAEGQTTRWDNTLHKWVPTSNVTVDSAGNLVVAGTVMAGGQSLFQAVMGLTALADTPVLDAQGQPVLDANGKQVMQPYFKGATVVQIDVPVGP